MTFEEIEAIAKPMIAISEEAAQKRKKFKAKDDRFLEEQSLGEALGASKCIQVLVAMYPDEMKIITTAIEDEVA